MVASNFRFLLVIGCYLTNFQVTQAGAIYSYVKLIGSPQNPMTPVVLNQSQAILDLPSNGLTRFEDMVGTFVFYDTARSPNGELPGWANIALYSSGSDSPLSDPINLPGNYQLRTVFSVGLLDYYGNNTITLFSSSKFGGAARTYSESNYNANKPGANSAIITGFNAWKICRAYGQCTCLTAITNLPGVHNDYRSAFYINADGDTVDGISIHGLYTYFEMSHPVDTVELQSGNSCS